MKHLEGSARGFLVLKDVAGRRLAYGDLVQTVRRGQICSRLTFHFRDGSLDDETTVYSQQGVFRLISDHHVQRGPSFPKPMDAFVVAPTAAGPGIVTTRVDGGDGKQKVETQSLEMPADLANGMALVLIENIPFAVPQSRLAYLASSSNKSRLIHLVVSPAGLETMYVAGSRRQAMNFVIRIELGGMEGIIAPVIGKQPDDVHVWVADGEVPVVVAEEGPLYQGGPVWRIELASPFWPSAR